MRFHCPNLPHTTTTLGFSWCAFTSKVRKFCDMMTDLGHEVYLYGGSETDARCTEFIPIGNPRNEPDSIPSFGRDNPLFSDFSDQVIKEITPRAQDKDFLCIIGGAAQSAIADAFPEMMAVEYGIGYSGTFAPYRVFESYAWMHTMYGSSAEPSTVDPPLMTDAVIPNYFDPKEFHFGPEPEDFYLYFGRLIDRKGWHIAVEVCEKLNKPLVIAGAGDPGKLPENCIYVGVLGSPERDLVMGKALATFCPSRYIEPFCGVHIESMLCGTPVITTDWGVFTETVTNGKQGFRCRTFREFCDAALEAPNLNRRSISRYARSKFTTTVVGPQYEAYFRRLLTLYDEGYYQ